MQLDDKVIAITGGGRGIGAATALRLAARGCRLALIDLDDDSLARIAEQLSEDNGFLIQLDRGISISINPYGPFGCLPGFHGFDRPIIYLDCEQIGRVLP